ncbi:MAG: tripartite tricarboxylate transporter substrate binding protein [Candidatus Zixiibacteriota bacterium]
MKTKIFLASLLSFFFFVSAGISMAQVDYPTKPIQMLIGYPPGGSTDIMGRALAQEAKKYLGKEILIINRPGANGTVAATHVVTQKPDGYTIGTTPSASFTITPLLQELKVDILKESIPILSFGKFHVGIFVKTDSPFKTFNDFIKYAKQNPGKVTYGHPGSGTRPHLVMEMIAAQEGAKINFVAFKGDTPTATALLGGHIMVASCSAGGWISHIQAGSIRLLAISEDERMDSFPDIPNVIELGYPFPLPTILVLYGPKGLPEYAVKKLEEAFVKASQSPAFREFATKNELYSKKIMVRDELSKFLNEEKTKTHDIIQKIGLGKK